MLKFFMGSGPDKGLLGLGYEPEISFTLASFLATNANVHSCQKHHVAVVHV